MQYTWQLALVLVPVYFIKHSVSITSYNYIHVPYGCSLPPLGSRSDPALLDALVWTLRSWPLELVEWRTANSHRLDITHNPEQDRWVVCYNYWS